ncbi:MAG: formylglycine-generating enzyme family protein [Luteimonas sp.]|nr:formylglycine-generating enzyme family protein [Luteimonas sp.]
MAGCSLEKLLRGNRIVAWGMALVMLAALAACDRDADQASQRDRGASGERGRDGNVTISGDDDIADALTWRVPEVSLPPDALDAARKRAKLALEEGRLHDDAESAIPLYLALLRQAPDDAEAKSGLAAAMRALLASGDEALADAGDDIAALRRAHVVAAVARTVRPSDKAVHAYLSRVDLADRLWELNRNAEHELRAGRYGERSGGALAGFREALRLQPGQPRALQGIAAVESGLIRRAEIAAAGGRFAIAERWLETAAAVRSGEDTIDHARARIEQVRRVRIATLRDRGVVALQQPNGITIARKQLAAILEIARPGDAMATELRERIDLATHYGLFRPGQAFTDALETGARGPQMRVVPHGGFRMGAKDREPDSADYERPQHYIRFERGFAMSIHEVSVGEFRRFMKATRRKTRAFRRGYSMAYDERNGNFIRRSGVDWEDDHTGKPAADDLPVLHVSSSDAQAYAEWLSQQSGRHYRLPSEAEFEYALRAGGDKRYPWGDGAPPSRVANLTGSGDHSPGGRSWKNAFPNYSDGYWGPAPVGRFAANAYGLHDLAGNVSEWVADCWHDGYRRAPQDGAAWVNPGCRMRVVRGGSWASSPAQSRSAWRAPADSDTTNARIGFRVVRDL